MVALITTQSHPCPYLTTKRLRIFFGCSDLKERKKKKTAGFFFGVIDSFGRWIWILWNHKRAREKCHTHRGAIINRRWASKQASKLADLGATKLRMRRRRQEKVLWQRCQVRRLNKLTIRSPDLSPVHTTEHTCVWVRPPRRLLHASATAAAQLWLLD